MLVTRSVRINRFHPVNMREFAAEAELRSGFIECALSKEEQLLRVRVRKKPNDNLGPSDRATPAVVKRIAEFL